MSQSNLFSPHKLLELCIVLESIVPFRGDIEYLLDVDDFILFEQVMVPLDCLSEFFLCLKPITLIANQIEHGRVDLVHHLDGLNGVFEGDGCRNEHAVDVIESL